MRDRIKGWVYGFLPIPIRIQGIPLYLRNCSLDLFDFLFARAEKDVPPRRLNISGGGDFLGMGMHNVSLCRRLGHLTPADEILDLGCGIGRTAIALSRFLDDDARYVGIDIIQFAIDWCTTHIASVKPNLSFVFCDVKNYTYNPKGRINAAEFVVPARDSSFSFCVATSLFTHLLPEATEQYLAEVGRVLKQSGRFLSTWFVINERTLPLLDAGKSHILFPHQFTDHRQQSLQAPEQAVAYNESYIRELFARRGLLVENVHLGGWSGYFRKYRFRPRRSSSSKSLSPEESCKGSQFCGDQTPCSSDTPTRKFVKVG